MVGRASFTSRFDINKIMQTGWFRFMEIVSDRYDFVLLTLFDLEPVKRFEHRSDVCLAVRIMA